MTTTSPAQQFSEDSKTLQSKVGSLHESVTLARTRDAVETVQATVNGMAQRIAGLRKRGYVFDKGLETEAQALAAPWRQLYPKLQSQISLQSSALVNSLRPIELQLPQLASMAGNPAAGRNLLARLQSSVEQVESKVSAAEKAIDSMYDQFKQNVHGMSRRLNEVDYLLTQLAEASFQLLSTEAGIAAVKAVWCKTVKEQKDDPEGVLYLTDQRLIFEQKEEVAAKKVLFVVTEKKKVQEMQLEAPLALVGKVDISKQGMLKNEDHIEIHFLSGAPAQAAHFHIWQEHTAWQGMINRARDRDFDKDRAVAIDQAAVDTLKSAPTQCPSCGANITTVVLRGMDRIKCEYCGFVIRL